MMQFQHKSELMQKLGRKVVARFGEDAFLFDSPGDGELGLNNACVHSAKDPKVHFSIIVQDNNLFSIQVEVEWPDLRTELIPFDIPCVEDDLTVGGVLDLLEKYRVCSQPPRPRDS